MWNVEGGIQVSLFIRGHSCLIIPLTAFFTYAFSFPVHAKQDSECVKTCSDLVEYHGPDSGALSAANLFNHNSSDSGNEKGSTRQAEIRSRGFNADGLPGGAWTTEHDQYCANHGYVTDETVRPQWGPLVPDAPTQTGFAPSTAKGGAACPYPGVEQGDDNCAVLTKKIQRCSLQKGQLVKMCAAYATAADGIAWQYVLAALDAGVAAICGYECLAESAGSTASNMCTIAACAGGVMETIATVAVAGNNGAIQQESTASGFEYLLGGVGALSGLGKCVVGIGGMMNDKDKAGNKIENSSADHVLDQRQAEHEKKAATGGAP